MSLVQTTDNRMKEEKNYTRPAHCEESESHKEFLQFTHLPHLERTNNPTTVKQAAATMLTTSTNAYTRFLNLKYFWIFLKHLSIMGANAAAPPTRNGLVMLFPVHIMITICSHCKYKGI